MKIGFDSKRFFHNQTGLGNYSREVIYSLCEYYSENEYLLFDSQGNESIDLHCTQLIRPRIWNPFWRSIGLGYSAGKQKIELFHGLSNEIPMDMPSNIPVICTIHDVIFRQFPNQYKPVDRYIYHKKTSTALQRCDKIIVPSQYTKNCILDYYNVDESKFNVIYQSINPKYFNHHWEPNLDQPYIVFHSSFNHRKNHINLVKSFAKLDNKEIKLILIGEGNEKQNIIKLIENLGISKRVEIFGYLDLDDLIIKLKKSIGFINPSKFEGFGIPLAEVAIMGIPIIASDIPVFREIMGNKISYFDPNEVDSITQAISELLKEPRLNKEYKTEVLEQVNRKAHSENLINLYSSF